ncbi:unnamed protein product, partial [Mesorhabditis belari]|uniref:Uncharacterized protein n=1 Tax=Mesorhabditis belari TaxID=2138241 RepID=A0AAF3EY21_9BILA
MFLVEYARSQWRIAAVEAMNPDGLNSFLILFTLIVMVIAAIIGAVVWCHGNVVRPHKLRQQHEAQVRLSIAGDHVVINT